MDVVPEARDGVRFRARSGDSEWLVAWHSPVTTPDGVPHGAAGICLTDDGGLVLISPDGKRWGLPGGRPEGEETWGATLRREVLEEAFAEVITARLLGFTRGECILGPERGSVLVRSFWRASVRLRPWEQGLEIVGRRIVPAHEWRDNLWVEDGYAPIYARALAEAGL